MPHLQSILVDMHNFHSLLKIAKPEEIVRQLCFERSESYGYLHTFLHKS